MEALLGIDVGTTNTKLRVYSVEGLLLAENDFVTPFHRESDGGYYQPDEIAHRLIVSITNLPGDIKRQIVALSIASFAESIVGVDSHGTALTKSIVWYDYRRT